MIFKRVLIDEPENWPKAIAWWAAFAGMLIFQACLKGHPPSEGMHLLLDHDVTSVTWSRAGSAPAGANIVYFERQSFTATPEMPLLDQVANLATIPKQGGQSVSLASGVRISGRTAEWDSQGKLLVVSTNSEDTTSELLRVDPVSGTVEDLGMGFGFRQIGDWVVLNQPTADGRIGSVARAPDGRTVVLGTGRVLGARGDQFLVLNDDLSLHLVSADGTDIVVATDVWSADLLPTAGPPILLLGRMTQGGVSTSHVSIDLSIRELSTGSDHVYATGVDSWVFDRLDADATTLAVGTTTNGAMSLHLISLVAAADEVIALPPPDPSVPESGMYEAFWRPGAEELWVFDGSRPITMVWRPQQPIVTIARTAALNVAAEASAPVGGVIEPGAASVSDSSPFVDHGAHWLSMGTDGMVHLNATDDLSAPEGPAFPVTGGSLFQVVGVGTDSYVAHLAVSPDRSDLYWVAPARLMSRLLATRIGDVVYGADRVLASSKMASEVQAADLTLYDLVTGAPTLIAQNMTGFALAPCDGCGPIDAGTSVVFAIQALYPNAYDGIWSGSLP